MWRREHPRGRRPAVWAPGETLVIDWGVLDGLHVFCAVLAWSRFRFVRFAADKKAARRISVPDYLCVICDAHKVAKLATAMSARDKGVGGGSGGPAEAAPSGVRLEPSIVDSASFLAARPAYYGDDWLKRSMDEFLESWNEAIRAEVGRRRARGSCWRPRSR